MTVSITLVGGPTALIEFDGFRLLTDPTFDAPGAYQLPHVKLEKLAGPALEAEAIGGVDAALLSHDQHADNLDHSGRDFLKAARRVPDPRAVPSYDGHQRHHRNRARLPRRGDRARAHRRMGAFSPGRGRSARVLRCAWLWFAPEDPRAGRRYRHRAVLMTQIHSGK